MNQTPYGFLLDLQPDWEASTVKFTPGYRTHGIRADAEQRIGYRNKPRTSIEYTAQSFKMTAAQRLAFKYAIQTPLVVPIWTHPIKVSTLASSTRLAAVSSRDGGERAYGAPNCYNPDLLSDIVYVEGQGLYTIKSIRTEGIELDGWITVPCTLYPVFVGKFNGSWPWEATTLEFNDCKINVEGM